MLAVLLVLSAKGTQPEARPARLLLAWGAHGSAEGEFDFPITTAVNADGQILVTDLYNARIQKFAIGP